MRIYDLKKLEKCYVCGNIDRNMDRFVQSVTSNLEHYTKVEHPKEIERQERLKNKPYGMSIYGLGNQTLRASMKSSLNKMSLHCNNSYNNSVIIVSGNCGIGTKSEKYYQETFEKLEKILADNNCYILFVRGNNDDPSYFNECKIDFEHVKTVPDYSIILLKPLNCLCIGGSISLDKEWKLSQEEQFDKKLYWKGEEPFFNEKELDEIISKHKIGCVISSTSPSFAFPGTNAFNRSKWLKDNKEIKSIVSSERKTLDKIYDKLMDADMKPYAWFYGRFKQCNQNKINDIVFCSLSPYHFENVGEIISNYFGIDMSKKLDKNIFALDSLFPEDNSPKMGYTHPHLDDPIEEDLDEEAADNLFEDEIETAPREAQGAGYAYTQINNLRAELNEIAAERMQRRADHADYFINAATTATAATYMPQFEVNYR